MNNSLFDERELIYFLYSVKEYKNGKLKCMLNTVKNLCFLKYIFNFECKDVLFFRFIEREDYKQLFELIYGTCTREKTMIIPEKKRTINLKNIMRFIRYIPQFSAIRKVKWPEGIGHDSTCFIVDNFMDNLIIYMRLITVLDIQREIEKHDISGAKALVVLGDCWMPEYKFLKYAEKEGLITVTAQHGLFLPDINAKTYDKLSFWKSPVRYELAWGTEMKELLHRYSPDVISIVCGNPIIDRIEVDEDHSLIGIATDVPLFRDYNQKLIQLAEKYAEKHNMRIKIRLHPVDSESEYEINSELSSFDREIYNAEFILAHTTTMLFTYIVQGKKAFKFRSSIPFYTVDPVICFDSLEELEKCVEYSRSIKIKTKNSLISYIGNEAKTRYTEFFEKYI